MDKELSINGYDVGVQGKQDFADANYNEYYDGGGSAVEVCENKSKLDYALEYVSRGWFVFPCTANKKPMFGGWQEKATSDEEIIKEMWNKYKNANIGILTGDRSELLVVDIDVKNGANGNASLEKYFKENPLPDTYSVTTPTGGKHLYFQIPDSTEIVYGNRTNLLKGIDIRANGGYVVAGGSTVNGKAYEKVPGIDTIEYIPTKLMSLLTEPKKKSTSSKKKRGNSQIQQGERNDYLFKLACRFRKTGIDYDEAKTRVLQTAKECSPTLSEDEALNCLDSAWSYDVSISDEIYLTDLRNARQLVKRYGLDIRYVFALKKWYHWDSNIWVQDDDGQVERYAKEVLGEMYREAIKNNNSQLKKQVINSESRNKIKAMVELASTEAGIPLNTDKLDNDPFLLGIQNGIINLKDGKLLKALQEKYITMKAGVLFEATQECPLWLRFVGRIMGDNTEMIEYLQRALGYSLTGNINEQCVFFLYGSGANGKSTLLTIMKEIMGGYGKQVQGETFSVKNNSSSHDLARLRGSRFLVTSETEDGKRFAESLIKQVTGGDGVTARFLYGEHFEYKPSFKIWIAGNHKPVIRGDDNGIWRRIRLIPFTVSIPEDEQDLELYEKLLEELPGIFNWVLEGCLKWQKNGLKTPKEVLDATRQYRDEMDLIAEWINEKCYEDLTNTCPVSELYASYKAWAELNSGWAMSMKKFSGKLNDRGYRREKTPEVVFRGIILNAESSVTVFD